MPTARDSFCAVPPGSSPGWGRRCYRVETNAQPGARGMPLDRKGRVGRPLDLDDPVAVLLAVHRALQDAGQDTAVYGGLALAVYGPARETKDADLAVVGASANGGLKALQAAGIEAAVAFDRAPFGGNFVTRFMLLGSATSPGINTADLVEPRSARYGRAALDRALEGELRSETLRILAPEDFVLFKVLSTRERDLEDAASVLRSLGDRITADLIAREVDRLRDEIRDHDISGRWTRAKRLASQAMKPGES